MKVGKQTRRDAKGLFRSTFTGGAMNDDRVRQVVKQVLELKPRGFIAILEHFKRLVKREIDRRIARVESAVPLSAEQQAGVSSSLERMYGKGLNISFEQNSSLIGGLRVKVGSDVYDGSVAGRLEQLEQKF
jgi:F-type H+-transporting ATPase subunit delta